MAINHNIWAWSATVPADNATVDASINWAEGQDPATVNNSARGMMTAIAKMADVQSGNVSTVGSTANAIVITTGQSIEAGQQALGFRICFKASATNTGATTVAVDGLTAVAIQRPNGDALSAGDIVSGAFHDIAFDGTNYRLFVPGAGGAYGTLSGSNTWTGSNSFNGTPTTIGNDVADVVVIKGTTVNSAMSALMGNSSVTALRSAIGLGTEDSVAFTDVSVTDFLFVSSSNTFPVAIRQNLADSADPASYYAMVFQDTDPNTLGSITVNGFTNQTVYNTSSDGRLKDVIGLVDDAGTIIDQLEPVYFTWRRGGGRAFGFIAQDVAEVLPEAVTKGNDKQPSEEGFIPWMMQKGSMEALLVAEIKALRARVAALEAG